MDRTEEDLYNSIIRISSLSENATLNKCVLAVLKLKKNYLEGEKPRYDNFKEYVAILGTYDAVLKELESLKTSREQK